MLIHYLQVLNSLTDDLLHASWRCCTNFGRFAEVGKRDIVDAGKLDMELFYHEDQFYRDIWIKQVSLF